MTLKKKARNFFKKAAIKMIRSRQHRAAQEIARQLIRENADFRNVSEVSLTHAIMSKREIKIGEIGSL